MAQQPSSSSMKAAAADGASGIMVTLLLVSGILELGIILRSTKADLDASTSARVSGYEQQTIGPRRRLLDADEGPADVLRHKLRVHHIPPIEYDSQSNLQPLHITKPQQYIVGGTPTPPGRYPYAASLITENPFSAALRHECGATLIGPDILLTAAHCMKSSIDGDQINSAVLGQYDTSNSDKSTFEYFVLENELAHPDYSRYPVPKNDVKIIKLYGRSSHAPVRLNSDPNIPHVGDRLTAMGWGSTNTNGKELSKMLQQVDLGYVPNEQCDKVSGYIHGVYHSYEGRIEDNMLCAFETGRDTCMGDSGSALIVRGKDSGNDVQVGVTSFGISCATKFPGVSTRISSYYEW